MADIVIRISDKALKIASVVLTGALLVWGFSHVWSSGLLRPKYEILMFVPDSQSIHVGAAVRLDGMRVGSVRQVELAMGSADSIRRVEVKLRVEKRFQSLIRDDSTAHIAALGLLGDHYVSIQRGYSGSPIRSGGEIRLALTKDVTATDFLNAIAKKAECPDAKKNSIENNSLPTKK